jgi:hypothetical protein
MAGVEGVSTENRMKILSLGETMTAGRPRGVLHGAGSPQSQRNCTSARKLNEKMKYTKKLAKIPNDGTGSCRFKS